MKRQTYRKIQYLLTTNIPFFDVKYLKADINDLLENKNLILNSSHREIVNLIIEHNINIELFHEYWKSLYYGRLNYNRNIANQISPIAYRDNKNIKVGSGNRNKNTIRFPRKVRKTAWKRFYKLFPNEKQQNENIKTH